MSSDTDWKARWLRTDQQRRAAEDRAQAATAKREREAKVFQETVAGQLVQIQRLEHRVGELEMELVVMQSGHHRIES